MFRQVFTVGNPRYNIYVFGNITNVYFTMVLVNEAWTFFKPELIETWIREVEPELNYAIASHRL